MLGNLIAVGSILNGVGIWAPAFGHLRKDSHRDDGRLECLSDMFQFVFSPQSLSFQDALAHSTFGCGCTIGTNWNEEALASGDWTYELPKNGRISNAVIGLHLLTGLNLKLVDEHWSSKWWTGRTKSTNSSRCRPSNYEYGRNRIIDAKGRPSN